MFQAVKKALLSPAFPFQELLEATVEQLRLGSLWSKFLLFLYSKYVPAHFACQVFDWRNMGMLSI